MIERLRERLPLLRPMILPLILYLVLLTFAMIFVSLFPASPWRYAVVLTPIIPGFFIAAGIMNMLRKLDEMSRKVILESMAVAFAATLILLLSLVLLEGAGMQAPSSIYALGFMGVVLIAAKLILSRRYE